MELGIIIALVIIIAIFTGDKAKSKKHTATNKSESEKTDNYDYTKGYQPKWLFTYNEKDAHNKIKEITDSLNLRLFAKVRLFDIIEPKQGIEKRQGHIYKIQAKHVDFVICNEKLVAKAIIELDDASHEAKNRIERDLFVDTVLTNCGYKVIHIKAVEAEKLKNELQAIFEK